MTDVRRVVGAVVPVNDDATLVEVAVVSSGVGDLGCLTDVATMLTGGVSVDLYGWEICTGMLLE